jgi:hypothetical protein
VADLKTKTVAELEEILLAELRKAKGCEGAGQVTIIARDPRNWICGPVRPGTADIGLCRTALNKIETRLQSVYTLKL